MSSAPSRVPGVMVYTTQATGAMIFWGVAAVLGTALACFPAALVNACTVR